MTDVSLYQEIKSKVSDKFTCNNNQAGLFILTFHEDATCLIKRSFSPKDLDYQVKSLTILLLMTTAAFRKSELPLPARHLLSGDTMPPIRKAIAESMLFAIKRTVGDVNSNVNSAESFLKAMISVLIYIMHQFNVDINKLLSEIDEKTINKILERNYYETKS